MYPPVDLTFSICSCLRNRTRTIIKVVASKVGADHKAIGLLPTRTKDGRYRGKRSMKKSFRKRSPKLHANTLHDVHVASYMYNTSHFTIELKNHKTHRNAYKARWYPFKTARTKQRSSNRAHKTAPINIADGSKPRRDKPRCS